jgi:hypothetical protein
MLEKRRISFVSLELCNTVCYILYVLPLARPNKKNQEKILGKKIPPHNNKIFVVVGVCGRRQTIIPVTTITYSIYCTAKIPIHKLILHAATPVWCH